MMNAPTPLHPTTEGALAALRELSETKDFSNILDMGCGAGILTLTAALLWPEARLTAADIDVGLVQQAAENIRSNELSARALATRSDGFSSPILAQRAPYDLIVCNILVEPILRMLNDLAKNMAPGGFLILSGLLVWLVPQIEAALPGLNLKPLKKLGFGEWQTVIILQQ